MIVSNLPFSITPSFKKNFGISKKKKKRKKRVSYAVTEFWQCTFQHYTMLPNLSALSKYQQVMLVACLLESCRYMNEATLHRNGVLSGLIMFVIDIDPGNASV